MAELQQYDDELKALFQKWSDGTANEHEKNRFLDLLAAADLNSDVVPLMEQSWKEAVVAGKGDQSKYSGLAERVFRAVTDEPVVAPVHRLHFLRTAWKYVAAAVIVLAIGVYYWQSEKVKVDKEKTVLTSDNPADVLPGSNRAVLTLGDGRRMVLDSAGDVSRKGAKETQRREGDLALEHGLIVQKADGSIDYSESVPVIPSEARNLFHKLATPRGGQYQLTLSDGSRVWLNAASSITYPATFAGKTREVSVTGEVYFEVAKNKNKPFIVKTAKEQITVLGTEFNVNTYEDESPKISLVEGSVKVMQASASSPIFAPLRETKLEPGEAYQAGKVIKTNINQDVAWKNGLFDFNGSDLQTVMRQLSRWYNIDVVYQGTPPEFRFRGKLQRDLTLNQVLKILGEVEVKFNIQGNKLIVTP